MALLAPPAAALPDNMLSPEEIRDGWILLFDGKSMDNWMTETGKPSQRPVEDGAINPHGTAGPCWCTSRSGTTSCSPWI